MNMPSSNNGIVGEPTKTCEIHKPVEAEVRALQMIKDICVR